VDTTPALTLVVGEVTGPQRTAFIHDARGIHAQVGDALAYAVTDGLGSVRAWTSAAPPDAFITYDPYGTPDMDIAGFAFTGEPRDATGLQYHRARYYDPALGAWASLDQLETPNRYAYVDGNVVNWTDPSGLQCEPWDIIMTGPSGGCDPDNLECGPYRKVPCSQLKQTLDQGLVPTFEQMSACYMCVDGWSGLEENRYLSYLYMMQQALTDGITTQEHADSCLAEIFEYVVTPTRIDHLGPIELSGWGDDGYAEGVSLSASAVLGVQTSREVVYNFATFQRSEFVTNMVGLVIPGASGSVYFSHIEGFVRDPSQNIDQFDGGIFLNQYTGESIVNQGGASYQRVEGSTSHFYSYGSTFPEISGNTYSMAYGVGFSLYGVGINGGSSRGYTWHVGNNKSYVGPLCLVDIDELTNDIIWGNGSPVDFTFDQLPLGTVRRLAATEAEARARAYNAIHVNDPCSCRPEG
jgi:RHS repeat-associated protein